MKTKNQIVNYFVIAPYKNRSDLRVVKAKIPIEPDVAKKICHDQTKRELSNGEFLQVCFDMGSKMIYTPNASQFNPQRVKELLTAAKYRILKDFGEFSSRPPINNSPFLSLRVRSLESFGNAHKLIQKHYDGKHCQFIPIIEANLDRMPTTVKSLPNQYSEFKNFRGGYIGKECGDHIVFVDEGDGVSKSDPCILFTQETPFVLINTSFKDGDKSVSIIEKEWVILNAYKDYLEDLQKIDKTEDVRSFTDLYAIKRLLYLGWTLEEVSRDLLKDVTNIADLLSKISKVMESVLSLKSENLGNPCLESYYITFKIGNNFPIRLNNIFDRLTGEIKTESQFPYFKIIDYDRVNSYILLETPVFIPAVICEQLFKPKSLVFIAQYNSLLNKIDVKTSVDSFDQLKKERRQLLKIRGLIETKKEIEELKYRTSVSAQGEWALSPLVINVRRISDYPYAAEFIKSMCDDSGVPFRDLSVVVGPIEYLFGVGVQGGFMNEKIFEQNNMEIPFPLTDDISISPPVIFVNSVENPSYPEQTEILIHEYKHYINGIMHSEHELDYEMPVGDDINSWYAYLTNPDEVEATKAGIKFDLQLGKSSDEIIGCKFGGKITIENYQIALKFSELVQESMM